MGLLSGIYDEIIDFDSQTSVHLIIYSSLYRLRSVSKGQFVVVISTDVDTYNQTEVDVIRCYDLTFKNDMFTHMVTLSLALFNE